MADGEEVIEVRKSELERLVEEKVEEKLSQETARDNSPNGKSGSGLDRRQFLKKSMLGIGGLAALALPGSALDVRDEEFNVYTTESGVSGLDEALIVDGSHDVSIPNGDLDLSGGDILDVNSVEVDVENLDSQGDQGEVPEAQGDGSLSMVPKSDDPHGNEAHDRDFVDESEASDAAPVQSVNGFEGTVVLDFEDVGAAEEGHDHSGETVSPGKLVLPGEFS